MKLIKKAVIILTAAITLSACGNGAAKPSEQTEKETTTSAADTSETRSEAPAATTEISAPSSDSENNQQNTKEERETADASEFLPENLELKPAMWKASDPATGNYIYLLGTFRAIPETSHLLPEYMTQAFHECDGLAVEYDTAKIVQPDTAEAREYNNALMYNDDSVLSDHLSETTYNALKQFVKGVMGSWEPRFESYKIGYWIGMVSSYQTTTISGFDFSGAIDNYFIAEARENGKPITDIETLSVQTSMVNAFTDAFGDYVLSESLKSLDDDPKVFAKIIAALYTAWATGDPEEFDRLNQGTDDENETPEELRADAEDFTNKTLTDRNKGMAERAAEFIKNGDKLFFMAELDHFAGSEGIPALLTNMGFNVERIES